MPSHISIRCRQAKHTWVSQTTIDYKCNGFAYPGKVTDPAVPCTCNCHLPGAKPPDDDVK